MRWIFFHGLFGDWGWEQLDDKGQAVAESRSSFDSREEAETDAAAHGYVPPPAASSPRRAGARAAGALPEQSAGTSCNHVMVIQRDVALCREVTRLLADMHVTATTSCEHALKQAETASFACYVVDCSLSDGGLARFCGGLRVWDPHVPIIAYTDDIRGEGGSQVMMAGANLLLRRPLDAPALYRTITGLLQVAVMRARDARHAAEHVLTQAVLAGIGPQMKPHGGAPHRGDWSEACRRFAETHAMRLSARVSFVRSGGTRAEFERAWPAIISEVSRERQ